MKNSNKRIRSGMKSAYHLKFVNLTLTPLINREYEAKVLLLNGDQLVTGLVIKLKIAIAFGSEYNIVSNNDYANLPSDTITIGKSGSATFKYTLNELSSLHDNKKYMFILSLDDSNPSDTSLIKPTVSPVMDCVLHKLSAKVINHENHSNFDYAEGIWYKDESGKDKCIDVMIELHDNQDCRVTSRSVPLKPFLTYGVTGELVIKQDILQILPESRVVINETGFAIVKLRLNDVSKNHQRQAFSILWTANSLIDAQLNDISPVYLEPIEVKSKKTKRIRESEGSISGPNDSRSSKKKYESASTFNSKANPNAVDQRDFIPSSNIVPPSSHYLPTSTSDNHISLHKQQPDLNQSLGVVLAWMGNAVEELRGMRWRQIGVEHGSERPLYEMNNPNTLIDMLLSEYTSSVQDNIRSIVSQYKHTDLSSISSKNSMSSHPRTHVYNGNHSQNHHHTQPEVSYDRDLQLSWNDTGAASNGHTHSQPIARNRHHSLDTEADWGNIIQRMETAATTTTNSYPNLENHVFYINATPVQHLPLILHQEPSKHFEFIIGSFCAFNISRRLVGFYREMHDQFNTTVITFYPLASYSTSGINSRADISFIHLHDYEVLELESSFQEKVQHNSHDVFSLEKCNDDREKMKQDAMVHFWLSEVTLLEGL